MTVYRPADLSPGSDERRFVISSWSSSYKASDFAGLITDEDWADVMHVQFGKILDRPTTRTFVAVGPPSFIYGFIAGDTSGQLPIVHYVYVKDGFRSERTRDGRREGPRYARGLFAAVGIDPRERFLYTCRTPVVSVLAPRLAMGRPESGPASKIPRAAFRPAAGRYNNYQEQHERQR